MASLLDCISSLEEWGKVCTELDNYQKKHYNERFTAPADDYKQVVINAPDYEEMEEIRMDKEMRQRPHGPRRVA